MKTLQKYINEKLVIGKNTKSSLGNIKVKDLGELKDIINRKYSEMIIDNKTNLDLTDIDVSNLNTLHYESVDCHHGLFFEFNRMKSVDVTGWDVSNVKDVSYMFYSCTKLETIKGIENWDVKSLEATGYMFWDCDKLKNVDLSGWSKMLNNNLDRNCKSMFVYCPSKIIPKWYKDSFGT